MPIDNNFRRELEVILENNALDSEHSTPKWLVDLFYKIANKETTPVTKFIYREPGTGDVFNFIAELEDIMDKHWNDTGEDIEMHFDKIQVIANISLESSSYYVKYYEEKAST